MRHLTITLQPDWKKALRDAGRLAVGGVRDGAYCGEFLNFESAGAFFGKLTERRWAIVHTLQASGPISVRELGRRVSRDVKRVHEDVQILRELGLVEPAPDGGILCPFADIHVDMHLQAVA
ncbi:MAG: hypothetical protein HGB05_20740 [Chloroflexi bacterium]|nr:hypothetical protein [Chloroflexota bacterium]